MDPILHAKARRLAARQQVEADWSAQPHLTSDKAAMTHQVSVALMKFLSEVAIRLGVAKHVYVVGGAVRNFIIDQPIKDIDVVIDSVRAGQDSDWFAVQVGKAIPTATSLTTNQYGVAILTIKGDWEVEGQNLKGEVLEIANARKESYGGTGGKGYKPHMVEPATVEEDVIRREFTFNTLMWRLLDLAKGPDKAEIIDLTGCGIRDLQEGVARCPSPPDKTFADDPTRMLRAIKFFVKYGLTVSPDVEASIKKNAPTLKNAPHEAISSLLIGTILHESTAIKGLKEMKRLGLLDVVADMVRTNKTFRATMQNWASNQKVLLLFDMMDLGLPLNVRANFLSKEQQLQLRRVSLGMDPGEPERFLAILKQPGRLVDMKHLIQETGLKGRDIQKLNEAIRETLLADPELRHSARKLTREVLRPFPGRRASGRGPATLPVKRGRADFYVYGDDSGNWELSQFADFGSGKAGKWAMTSSLASRNDWKTLSVDNATEHHRGFRKALKEMVAKYPELIEYLIQFDGPWMPVTKLVGAEVVKPQVDLSKITFYHGTSSAAWETIQKNGLRPREMTKVDPAYGVARGAQPGRKDSIYLTTQSNTAMFAARDAARNTRSDMVILEITGLDPARFAPDEDSRKETAVESLEKMGSVAYVGNIPASKVRLYYREEVSWEQARRVAREFVNDKQLQEYLKDHPKADRRKHKVRGPSTKKTAPKGTKKNLKAKFQDFAKKLKAQMKDTGNLGKTLGAMMSGKPVSEKQRADIKRQVADVFKMLVVGTTQVSPIPGTSLVWPAVVASINKVFHKEYDWKPSAFQKAASEETFQRIFDAILSELDEDNTSKSAGSTERFMRLARNPKVPDGTGPIQLRYKGFKILNPNRYNENVYSRLFRAIDFALGMLKKRGVGSVITNTIKQFEISRGGGSSISGIYSSSKQSIRVAAETLVGLRQSHINRIVVHEIGHHVHMWYIPSQAKREWDKGWDAINKAQEDKGPHTDVRKLQVPLGLPSDYASEDLKEDFAETWATYMMNPQGLSQTAKYRFLHTLSLAGLYNKPVMRLADRYMEAFLVSRTDRENEVVEVKFNLSRMWEVVRLSEHYHGDEYTVTPRVPRTPYEDKNGDVIEDNQTKRVSLAPTIEKATKGLELSSPGGMHLYVSNPKKGRGPKNKTLDPLEWFSRCPSSPMNMYGPNFVWQDYAERNDIDPDDNWKHSDEMYLCLPDVRVTGELWSFKPVKMIYLGRIHNNGQSILITESRFDEIMNMLGVRSGQKDEFRKMVVKSSVSRIAVFLVNKQVMRLTARYQKAHLKHEGEIT